MTARTDAFRKSTVIASEFEHVLCYSLATVQDGWPVPSFGVNCEMDHRVEVRGDDGKVTINNGKHAPDGECCVIGLLQSKQPRAEHGGTGVCTFCGAAFIYGDVYRHTPTGTLVHVGHTCSDQLRMAANRARFDGKRLAFATKAIAEARYTDRVAGYGLTEAFSDDVAGKHRILTDMRARLRQYGELSDKQVAFALKLAAEIKCPPPKEPTVPAPVGRITITGEVVSVKQPHPDDGGSVRLTVKIKTDAGIWLALGTCPKFFLDKGVKRGDVVEFVATVKQGRDAHFGLTSRPIGVRVVSVAT